MGKRKERRLASKIGAGRRVKLDLFAEPYGDMGGSSPNDEVKSDGDGKHSPELHDSLPSAALQCSGEFNDRSYLRFVCLSLCKNPENPLTLLGQYSDDDLDAVSYKAEVELYDSKQAIESISEQLEEGEIGGNDELSCHNAGGQNRQTDCASENTSQVVDLGDLMSKMVASVQNNHEVYGAKQDPLLLASDIQTSGDVTTSWKMVLHEESNKYYYWNTITGETSWEIPEGFVHESAFTDGLECSKLTTQDNTSGDVYNATAFGVSVDDFSVSHNVGYMNGVSQMKMIHEQITPEIQLFEQIKADDNQLFGSSSVVGLLPCGTSTLSNYVLPEHYNGTVESSSMGNYAVQSQHVSSTEQSTHFASPLAKKCATLLENLKVLLGSEIEPGQHILLSRYKLELELRLSDIRELLPYESSVLPFWAHTGRQLNQLENSINSEIEKSDIKVSVTYLEPSSENHVQLKGIGDETKLSPAKDVDALVEPVMSFLDEVSNVGSVNMVKTSKSGFINHSDPGLELGTKVNDTALDEKASSNCESQAGEDVDMDIDMEVEAPNPVRNKSVDSGGQYEEALNFLLQPSISVVGESVVSESEFVIPPPPEEEWIPPPPPDDEGIPPPPPDEPDESLCPSPPPSASEAVCDGLHFSDPTTVELKIPDRDTLQSMYGELYDIGYAESSGNFCESTSTIYPESSFYEHTGSGQLAGPVDAVVYTSGLHNGPLPAVPMADTTGLSSSHTAANFLGCDSASTEMTLANALARVSSLPKQILNPLATSAMCRAFLSHGSSASVFSAPATVSGQEHVSASSFRPPETVAKASEASTVSKAQTKALRMKKPKVSVGSSLRSNKKVSSLVDKWKAAKEELEEEEERYESPLEILEKKRQREIEDWKAHLIASGEAKENANFQPLGANWRERVKRRRAQKEQATTETPSNSRNEGIKQPDIKALSEGLPLGWQVYWDDSSRQIYYSNSTTLETTWTRPM